MAREEDNTVSSQNQLKRENQVFGEQRTGKKILFLGNSITRHAPKPEIGWFHDWGMAASAPDKDYVHRTMARVWEKAPETSYLVAQIALWENAYWQKDLMREKFPEAVAYRPDVIVMRVVENVKAQTMAEHDFLEGYRALLDELDPQHKAHVVLTTGFWRNPAKDEIVRAVARERGYALVELGDLGADDRYTAKGVFEHAGVAAHPGDEGMEEIASRLFGVLREWL